MRVSRLNDRTDAKPFEPMPVQPIGPSPLGHRIMFALLALLAFALFAPTVVLPMIREYGAVRAEEAVLVHRCAALQDEIDHRARLIEAFAADPAVNEKLAMLDLQYRKPGEEILPVLPRVYEPAPPPKYVPPPARSELLTPDDWPDWAIRAELWAQQRQLIELFLDDDLRPIFLLMSAGLLIAAFALFAPRGPSSPRPRDEPMSQRPAQPVPGLL